MTIPSESLGWMTPVIVVFIAYTYTALETDGRPPLPDIEPETYYLT